MVQRIEYVGATPQGGFSVPLQGEAQAYFSRMTSAPSAAYQNAINTAIYKWKAMGVWSAIVQLICCAADTSQAALLDVTANARDATLVGGPTFTANKGFSNFSSSNGLAFGLNATVLVDNNFIPVFAGLVDTTITSNTFITCSGAVSSTPGMFLTSNGFPHATQSASASGNAISLGGDAPTAGFTDRVCGASRGAFSITPGSYGTNGGGPATRLSGYATTLQNSGPLGRLLVYGAILSTVTAKDAARFLTVLRTMLEDLAAYD